jgi:tetratricopeptide (TPR) repeat protein
MPPLRDRFSALARLGVPRLDDLLAGLSEAGAANLGTFDAEADDAQLRDFARWLGGATPDQIRQAAAFLHQLRPPIVRTLIGWVRAQNSPPVEPLTLEEPDDAIALDDLDEAPPAGEAVEPLPVGERDGDDASVTLLGDPRAVGLWGRVKSALGGLWSGLADLVSPGQARWARRRLDRARLLFEFDPEAALGEFDELVKRAERRKPREGSVLGEILRQAHLGQTRCLIVAGAFDDAAQTEANAQRWGPLTTDEQTVLCQAVLGVLPDSLPDYVVEVLARYVLLPDALPAVRGAAAQALRRAVEPSDDRVRLARAAEVGQRLLARSPDFGWVYFPHALVLERLGRFREAADAFRRAAEREPARADCHTGMGRCRDRLGDARGAREAWVEANRLAPDVETALAAARACLATAGTPFSPAERAASGDRTPVAFAAELFRTVTEQAPENAAAWAGLGECEWGLGRAAEAAAALERAVALDPRVPGTHVLLGRARLALGRTAAAREAAAAALRLAPDSDPALILAGDVAHDEGRFADAVGYYRKVKARPTDVPSLDRLAKANLEAGDPAVAVEVLTGRRPLAPAARLVLGRALARESRWAEAADILARGGPPPSAEGRYYLGAVLAGAGKLAEAEPCLLAARDDGAWRERATRQLGHLKYRAGDLAAARAYYADCPAPSAALDLARLDLLEGHTAEARAGFDAVLAADPGNRPAALGQAIALADEGDTGPMAALAADPVLGPAASERLGGVALAAGRYVPALEHLEKARAGRSRLPDALLAGLAACYLQLGRYAEALPPLVQLAEAHPDHPGVRHNLGLCRYQLGLSHARQGRWEPAGVDLTLAASLLEPTAPAAVPGIDRWATEASYRVAAEKIKTGPAPVLQAALKAIDRGCEAEPDNPRWYVASGLAHARAGFHADSAEAFARARELVPTRAGFALGYGLSLQADGKTEEAV